jgi:hypothetical protein
VSVIRLAVAFIAVLASTGTSAAAVVPTAPANVMTAPGAVAFPVDTPLTVRGVSGVCTLCVNPTTPDVGVARPDGGTILAGPGRDRSSLRLVAILRDGRPDPAFGVGGVADVRVPGVATSPDPRPAQILLDGAGGPLVVFYGARASQNEYPPALVARFTPAGALDVGYGNGGVATTGVQFGSAAVTADGGVVVTGAAGQIPSPGHDPIPRRQDWIVRRLTPLGAVDRTFGTDGTTTVALDASGSAIAIVGDDIAVGGRGSLNVQLAWLTATGALRGTPHIFDYALGPELAAHDGFVSVYMPTYTFGATLWRMRPDGGAERIDVPLSKETSATLVGLPGGRDLVLGIDRIAGGPHGPITVITYGSGASMTIPVPFSGGVAGFGLGQEGFVPGRPFARADGSVVLPGGVAVLSYTGDRQGDMHQEQAVLSLVPDQGLDPAFGGPRRAASLSLSIPPRSVAGTVRTWALPVDVVASGLGLAQVTVRARGRVVGVTTAPVFQFGAWTVRVPLTAGGRRALAGRHRVRVSVSAAFQDLVGAGATADGARTLK